MALETVSIIGVDHARFERLPRLLSIVRLLAQVDQRRVLHLLKILMFLWLVLELVGEVGNEVCASILVKPLL